MNDNIVKWSKLLCKLIDCIRKTPNRNTSAGPIKQLIIYILIFVVISKQTHQNKLHKFWWNNVTYVYINLHSVSCQWYLLWIVRICKLEIKQYPDASRWRRSAPHANSFRTQSRDPALAARWRAVLPGQLQEAIYQSTKNNKWIHQIQASYHQSF